MIGGTILALALPVPIIVSNFVRTQDMLSNDCTVQTYYFDNKKSKEVEEELLYYNMLSLTLGKNEGPRAAYMNSRR